MAFWPLTPRAREREEEREKERNMTQRALESRINAQLPSIVAYKIDNGYLVQVNPPNTLERLGEGRSGFHYCADHIAIADYIVSCNAREKLNIPRQGDMFVDAHRISTTPAITLTTDRITY